MLAPILNVISSFHSTSWCKWTGSYCTNVMCSYDFSFVTVNSLIKEAKFLEAISDTVVLN